MPELRTSLAALALATALPLTTVPAAAADGPSAAMVVAEMPGLPGYYEHYVTGINDLGQVVGSAQNNGVAHAVLWSPRGGPTDLGPGMGRRINQHGQVLGLDVHSTTGPNVGKPWIWFGGGRTTVAPPTAAWASAEVMNERGDVPLTYATSPLSQQPERAAVWVGGRYTELPLDGPHVWLNAINDAGVVAGSHVSSRGEFSVLRCAEGSCTALAGTPGYGRYDVEAINEAGVVVGSRGMAALRWEGDEVTVLSENGRVAHGGQALNERGDAVGWVADATGARHAVLWPAGGKPVDLGLPEQSAAIAINERGDVVGWASSGNSTIRAFLWRAGRITYLESLGGSYSMPVAINNHGVVVGADTTATGAPRAVRWAPAGTAPIR